MTNRCTQVTKTMPGHAERALAVFLRRNPQWNGAHWDDVLDTLLDSDSHLDVTEPIYEALDYLPEDRLALVTPVAVTLYYANRDDVQAPPSVLSVHGWVDQVYKRYHDGSPDTDD